MNLYGISLGGILAIDYANEYPQKVKSLVLIGVPSKVPKILFKVQNIIFKIMPKKLFETMAFNKKDTFILGSTMKKLDFSNRVQNIKCPTLVICGENDSANIKSAHYLAENIKNAKLEIMKNAGHIINEESPKELSKLLIEFWKD